MSRPRHKHHLSIALFLYPSSTRFGKAVPKTRIHAAVSANKRIKELFSTHVAEIVWAHKLSPETLHLPARDGIAEIQVFTLQLKAADIAQASLRSIVQTIDRAIPFPIFFEFHHAEKVRYVASYKRPSEADAAKWVIETTFDHGWQAAPTARFPLPVALDLSGLYDQCLRHHLPLPARPQETLCDHVTRCLSLEAKQRELAQLEARLKREKQFNRKVEIHAQLRSLTAEIASLASAADFR